MRRRLTYRRVRTVGAYLGLLPFVLSALFPFYWMAVTSLKKNAELISLTSIPFLVTQGITLDHYRFIFRETMATRWFGNSLLIATSTTAISLVISTMAAYALTRLAFRGAGALTMAIFVSYLVPPTLLFLPLSQIVAGLGLMDSLWSLVLTYPTFAVPFCTWLLMSYFQTIPRELEDSAVIDGATRLQALVRVILPVSIPGLISVALFSFTLSWGQLLYPLAFISSSTKQVLTTGLATDLMRADVFFWGGLMGGALLSSIPIVIVYAFFTGYFVTGLVGGAVKY